MSWECVSYWIEHHPGLASWLQAVFSVLAIAAAALFPVWHDFQKEKAARKNSRRNLLHFATIVRGINKQLLKGLNQKVWRDRWIDEDGERLLKIVKDMSDGMPLDLLVGYEMVWLMEIRSACHIATGVSNLLMSDEDIHDFEPPSVEIARTDLRHSLMMLESVIRLTQALVGGKPLVKIHERKRK